MPSSFRDRHGPLRTGLAERSAPLLLAGTACLVVGSVASGCFTSSEGLEPPAQTLYFPTGLVVSSGRTALYVANSDFDLQYNAGTVQAYDLPALRQLADAVATSLSAGEGIDTACGSIGESRNNQSLLYPAPCTAVTASSYVRASVEIGAFASGVQILERLDGPGARLFVPVRGDPSVTYFDISDDRDPANITGTCGNTPFCLDCGTSSEDSRCAADHRVGENPYTNIRNIVLPTEPVGIAATQRPGGDPIVVAHQTESSVSLLLNTWDENTRPTLEYFASGLPVGPTEVASIPVPRAVDTADGAISYRPGFLVTYREAPEISLFRYEDDARSSPDRPFLTRAGTLPVGELAAGDDQRGIAIDGSERAACESGCGDADIDCQLTCMENLPLRLFVASRSPASLLIGRVESVPIENDGQVTGLFDVISLDETASLSFGASRVEVGQVINQEGEVDVRVFAVAFDSRFIYMYDPDSRRIDAIIRTGRGPHDVAFDVEPPTDPETGHAYLYIGHFTDSYLGVVDLDMRRPTFGNTVLTVGPPVPPRETQ